MGNTYSLSVENKPGTTGGHNSGERKAEQRNGDRFLMMPFKHLNLVTPVRLLSLVSERGLMNALLHNSAYGRTQLTEPS